MIMNDSELINIYRELSEIMRVYLLEVRDDEVLVREFGSWVVGRIVEYWKNAGIEGIRSMDGVLGVLLYMLNEGLPIEHSLEIEEL